MLRNTIENTADGAHTDIIFDPVDASDVKVTVLKSYDNPENKYASAGEINVYKATKDVTLIDPIKILPEEGKSTTMKEGETQKVRYELTPEAVEAGGTVEWRVREGSILNVDENGVVTAVGAGTENLKRLEYRKRRNRNISRCQHSCSRRHDLVCTVE